MKKIILTLLIFFLTLPCIRAQINELIFYETWMQYTPVAFNLSSKYLGIKSKHSLNTKLVATASAFAVESAIVYALKYTIREERPDGSAFNSFPSGHTAAAFTGAELIRRDLGWGWGGFFYACGVGVAAGRVVHKRHWWWDTAAGAGVGILSATIGCAIAQALDLDGTRSRNVTGMPLIDPAGGSYALMLAWTF